MQMRAEHLNSVRVAQRRMCCCTSNRDVLAVQAAGTQLQFRLLHWQQLLHKAAAAAWSQLHVSSPRLLHSRGTTLVMAAAHFVHKLISGQGCQLSGLGLHAEQLSCSHTGQCWFLGSVFASVWSAFGWCRKTRFARGRCCGVSPTRGHCESRPSAEMLLAVYAHEIVQLHNSGVCLSRSSMSGCYCTAVFSDGSSWCASAC